MHPSGRRVPSNSGDSIYSYYSQARDVMLYLSLSLLVFHYHLKLRSSPTLCVCV